MTRRCAFLLALPMLAMLQQPWPAQAQTVADNPGDCRVAEMQTERIFPLPKVALALSAKHLSILVLGAGSSSLPGLNGAQNAYPARLEQALRDKLPGIEVKVTADVKSKRSAAEMVKSLPAVITATKPALVIWQTGTVDAMQSIEQDQFSQALDKGINTARASGADVVFVNPQYSPRTESMIALAAYAENMRWVALQQEVPLFDRFSIMKIWADLGIFDLQSATKKLDIAERVHNCIGRLLADLVIDASKPDEPRTEIGR